MVPSSNRRQKSDQIKLRSFGLLMGVAFLLIAFWPLFLHGKPLRKWAGIVAAVFMISGLLSPTALKPVHRAWIGIGKRLGWINSRIVLGIMFFGILTPMGWIMNLIGKRPLQLKYDPHADSYRVPKRARAAKHALKTF